MFFNRVQADEETLLEGLRRGDGKAVRQWFEQYQAKLLRLVLMRLSDEHDAEEIVQETFVNCLKHLPLFRGESSIWTWMVRIAQHEIADYYRKKYAKRTLKTLPLTEVLLAIKADDAHETAEQFRLVWQVLSHKQQLLLIAKYLDEKKVKQIAQEFGQSVKSIESELFRARRSFQAQWLRLSQN